MIYIQRETHAKATPARSAKLRAFFPAANWIEEHDSTEEPITRERFRPHRVEPDQSHIRLPIREHEGEDAALRVPRKLALLLGDGNSRRGAPTYSTSSQTRALGHIQNADTSPI